jgi:penicillin-binding protein-related factor A (putative recombinase)
MINDQKMSLLNGNTIELHYWWGDESHSMDAFVQNKCEYDFLGVLKEIAATFNVEIVIETEPLSEGGLRRWFKIISKEENKKATITIAIVVTLLTGVFVTPITTSISKVAEKLIEEIFEDKEVKELEKEKLKLEIDKLKLEIEEKNQTLQQNNVIKRKRSNFYESLGNYPKVDKVSFLIQDINKEQVKQEKIVLRQDFKSFVLVSDDLEPIKKENAIIEIISPVLKKGNYKWMGIYNGEIIPFNMKSNEFKTLIQTGTIQFKNGTSIDCFLEIKKKIDNEGVEKICGIDVLRVNNYFENDKPIETPEGRFHRQKKEADKNQLRLFSNDLND